MTNKSEIRSIYNIILKSDLFMVYHIDVKINNN